MKKIISIVLLLCSIGITSAQFSDCQWDRFAKTTNSKENSQANAIIAAIDSDSEFITAWIALDATGIHGVADKLDNLEIVTKYLKNHPTKDYKAVSAEIKEKGWEQWKNDYYDEVGDGIAYFLDDAFVLSKRAEVVSDGLPTQFPSLSIDELTAIKVYTSDEFRNGVKIYSELNRQLRAGNLDIYYQGLSHLLNDGLGKMVQYNGNLVFRGCGQAESKLAKNWNVGDEVTFKDFKSSSVTERVAEGFMNSGGGDVIYEISNPKGYNICDISCSPNEAEIFFKSDSKFRVEELTFQPRFTESDPIVRVIKLTYIP